MKKKRYLIKNYKYIFGQTIPTGIILDNKCYSTDLATLACDAFLSNFWTQLFQKNALSMPEQSNQISQ